MCGLPFPLMIKAARHVYGENTSSFLYSLYECRELYRCVCCWLHDDGCILDYTFCFLSGGRAADAV